MIIIMLFVAVFAVFKIDLIVWKQRMYVLESKDFLWFKIDLIVWKFVYDTDILGENISLKQT